MPVYLLDGRIAFPDPREADPSGLIGVGGDLRPERLMLGYSLGIFPWYGEGQPILWHAPAWRMVLRPDELHVGRSLRKAIRRAPYDIRYDTDFEQVIDHCAEVPRDDQDGTWITEEMRDAYVRLHELGHAHCVEAWDGDRMVGGAYGVTLGGVFFGESMFATARDASKIAFVHLVRQLETFGYGLIDCQVYTDHLARFGATEWPRDEFLAELAQMLRRRPTQVWPTQVWPTQV